MGELVAVASSAPSHRSSLGGRDTARDRPAVAGADVDMTSPITFIPVLLLIAIGWSVRESGRRWMTLLWIVVTLTTVVCAAWVASLIWPYGAEIFGYTVVPVALLLAAFVGFNHMRTPPPRSCSKTAIGTMAALRFYRRTEMFTG